MASRGASAQSLDAPYSLKRDFQALIDHPDHQVKRLGRDLMRPTKKLFRHWSRCRDGTITRKGLLCQMKPIREEIDGLLLRGAFSRNPKLVGICRQLYDHRDWLWTFLGRHVIIAPR